MSLTAFLLILCLTAQTLTILGVFSIINDKLNEIMPNLKERFDEVNVKLAEASAEIIEEIRKLREGTLTLEQEESLANIEAKAVALANLAPPVEPPPPPPEP